MLFMPACAPVAAGQKSLGVGPVTRRLHTTSSSFI
jgi:hypothetical protein